MFVEVNTWFSLCETDSRIVLTRRGGHRPGTETEIIIVTINVKVNSDDDTFSGIGCKQKNGNYYINTDAKLHQTSVRISEVSAVKHALMSFENREPVQREVHGIHRGS